MFFHAVIEEPIVVAGLPLRRTYHGFKYLEIRNNLSIVS